MIGEKLRLLRNKKNFSLRKLAAMTGLSHSFICDIERGRCNPSINNLKLLADALGVEPDFFLRSTVVESDQNDEKVG